MMEWGSSEHMAQLIASYGYIAIGAIIALESIGLPLPGESALVLAALQTALAYHQAWTSHDLDKAMSYVADGIVCDAPAGRLEGADAYRGFLGPFVQITTGAKMIAAFGDDETALVMYDTQTVPVNSAPGAEYVTVKDGKIIYSRFVFDRAPFDAARNPAS